MSEWISVNYKLPEFTGEFGGFALVSDDVKALSESRGEVFADFSTEGWTDEDGNTLNDVTHWMPLPEPPK